LNSDLLTNTEKSRGKHREKQRDFLKKRQRVKRDVGQNSDPTKACHHTSLFNPANPVIVSSAFYLFKLQRKQRKQRKQREFYNEK